MDSDEDLLEVRWPDSLAEGSRHQRRPNAARIHCPKPPPLHIDISDDDSQPVPSTSARDTERLLDQALHHKQAGIKGHPICISDSEPEEIQPLNNLRRKLAASSEQPAAKRMRTAPPQSPESNTDVEEDEYEAYFDPRQNIFPPLPRSTNVETTPVDLQHALSEVHIEGEDFKNAHLLNDHPSVFEGYDWTRIFDVVSSMPWAPPRKPAMNNLSDTRRRGPMSQRDSLCVKTTSTATLDALGLVHQTKPSDGSTINIVQMGSTVVVGSATCGGEPDYDTEKAMHEEPNEYNTTGNLVVLSMRQCRSCDAIAACSCGGISQGYFSQHDLSVTRGDKMEEWDGHLRVRKFVKTGFTDVVLRPKYFSINCTAADPVKTGRFVSSGNDRSICIWQLQGDDSPPKQLRRITFKAVPLDLHYEHGSSRLAITFDDGTIYVYEESGLRSRVCVLHLLPHKTPKKHGTGSMVWGRGPTKGLIFASSEPNDPTQKPTGWHRAFKVATGAIEFTLEVNGSGDAMALSPIGDRLALVTCDGNNEHVLRIFNMPRGKRPDSKLDVQRTALSTPIRRERQHEVDFDEITVQESSGEVNMLAFSPDGRLLAVARSDDAIEVYDAHALERGALYAFEHPRMPMPSDQHYGVVKAAWIGGLSGPLYLVSGGADGCIRLWDLTKHPRVGDNGKVIASVPHDIAYFSLGDVSKDELPLIVGDLSGIIYLFGRSN